MTISKINVLFSRPKDGLVEVFNVLPEARFNLISCPMITIEPVDHHDEIDDAFKNLESFSYLIFTSQYAVTSTIDHLNRLGMPIAKLQQLTICAVGPMVSQQLNKFDLNAQMIPHAYDATSLCDLFSSIRRNSKRVLFPRGNNVLGFLVSSLSRKGYDVVAPIVYRTEFRQDLACLIDAIKLTAPLDCIALTSPLSVLALKNTLKMKGKDILMQNTVISAIGPATQKACIDAGWPVQILPTEYTVQSMARAIFRYFQRNPRFAG